MSTCCENCFFDNVLINEVKRIGKIGTCDYCESENVKCVDLEKIATMFEPVISLYTPTIEFKSIEELKEEYFSPLWDCVESQWQILSDSVYVKNKEEAFYGDLLKILGIEDKYSEENVGIELDYYGIPIQEANNLNHMWDEFANEIKFKNRYFLSSDKNKDLLEKISGVLPFLVISYEKGTYFYRARINSSRHQKYNCGSEMSAPPSEKCSGGRANPVGISYLYFATENKTALGEVEPLLSDSVTVAEFELKNSIDVI